MRDFLNVAKALSDRTRVRALLAVKDRELCLCQIVDVLGLAPATVSKHMNLLHRAGLVDRRRQGKWHFFRMARSADGPSRRALAWVRADLDRDPTVLADARRIREVRRKDLEERSACYRS